MSEREKDLNTVTWSPMETDGGGSVGDKIALEMKLHISRRAQHRERWTNCIVEYMREVSEYNNTEGDRQAETIR